MLQNLTDDQVQTIQNDGVPLSKSEKLKVKKKAEREENLVMKNAWKSSFATSLKAKVNKQA
jgi:hypothetical protein